MKKLALYVHHDPKGEVRDYIIYCLKGLQEVVDEILFIVNGSISAESRLKLEALGVKILVRENKGFDWWAWKAGIEYYGYEKIAQYDELLLTNNTYYGPIYPFSEMWNKMDQIDCDFWGISRHPELDVFIENNPDNKVYEFIQSFWIVFKKKILKSHDFVDYWQNIKPQNSYQEMIGYGETKLTKYFEEHGFKSAVFLDFDKYSKLIYNPPFVSDIQIIEDRCPILKRKFLFDYKKDILSFRSDYITRQLLEYLKEQNLYDVELIWQDLLATQSMSGINDCLHLNYILPSKLSAESKKHPKTAVIMYIYPLDLIDYCYRYAQNIPEYIDIIIVNTREDVAAACRKIFSSLPNKVEYRLQQNRGRDNTALLITCKDVITQYEYIGFVHSKRSPHFQNTINGEFFRDHCFISLLYSKNYIENIIATFSKNKRLGILCPLLPNASNYAHLLTDKWACNYDNARKFLIEKMKLNLPLDENQVAPFGGMYWFRSEALKTLSSYPWKFEDFPEEPLSASDGLLTHTIERIVSLLAQYDGYYTAWVAPDFYGEAYLNNMYYKYRELRNFLTSQSVVNTWGEKINVKDIYHYTRNKLRYWKYKFLSAVTFGQTHKKIKKKRKKLKYRIKIAKHFIKGS